MRVGRVSAEVKLTITKRLARARVPKPAPAQIAARRKLMPEIHPIIASGIGPSHTYQPTDLSPTSSRRSLRAFVSLWPNILKGLLTRVRAFLRQLTWVGERNLHMQRTLFRVAALALSASALSACSMMAGGDKVAAAAPRPADTNATAIAADVTSVIHQAQALRAKGDLDGELRIISQLMLAQPDDARVVGEYGKLLVQQARSNDAVQFLNRAVELAPSDWTYYSALGVAYDQLADPANAKLAYERAL